MGRSGVATRVQAPIRRVLNRAGLQVVRYRPYPRDYDDATVAMIERVKDYTKTSPERLHALRSALVYLHQNQLPGAVVECGVWRGGSMMAAALTLLDLSDAGRELYLFDTFEGMTAPSALDVRHDGASAAAILDASDPDDPMSTWCAVDEGFVQRAMAQTGYPAEHVHLVRGLVEDTVPEQAPEQIALLRLDTDWYESTRHELVHLMPRVVPGGVLILDDYGHWDGVRRAVDEYLAESGTRLFLHRVDEAGRIAVVC